MKFQVLLLFICGIEISSKLTGIVCVDEGREYCCANSENVNDVCTNCRKGMTLYDGDRCVSCKNNMYGYKCIEKCDCGPFQRCDPEVGCVPKTNTSTIHSSYTANIEPVLPPSEKVTANEATISMNETIEPVSSSNDKATTKDTTNIINGTANTEWIVYTLCITGCFVMTGLCHIFRAYKKRYDEGVKKVNEHVMLKPSELNSYINDIYDDVDDNSLTFVTTESNIQSQASQKETINFVFNDTQSSTGDEDGEFGYLDLYFATKGDENRLVEERASQNESLSTSSSSSNVEVQNNRYYTKPNIPLHQYCQDNSHSCKVAVMVHHCIERSQGIDDDDISNIYSNVCTPLQNDRQINSHDQSNEMQISPDSKTVHETTLQTASPSVSRSGYFQDHLIKYVYAAPENIIADCGEIASVKDKICDKNIPKTL